MLLAIHRPIALFALFALLAPSSIGAAPPPQGVAFDTYFKSEQLAIGNDFGNAVAIDGDTMIVGEPYSDALISDGGAVFVYVRSGDSWVKQASLFPFNPSHDDRFGSTVAIDGDTVVVGAPDEKSSATGIDGNGFSNVYKGAGAAYVFVREGDVWTQQAYLKASNTGLASVAGDQQFGCSVSISGDTVCVGSRRESSSSTGVNGVQVNHDTENSGAAYVFKRTGSTWSQEGYLKASNTEARDQFGSAVGLAGNRIAVGAPFEDSPATGVNGDQAGNSAPYAGAVYLFERAAGVWTQTAYIKPYNTSEYDRFGGSVAMDKDVLVVGANREQGSAHGASPAGALVDDNTINGAGAVYTFRLGSGGVTPEAYLKPFYAKSGESHSDISFLPGGAFGSSVDVAGDRILVGAPWARKFYTGVNGGVSKDKLGPSTSILGGWGAAYLFRRQAGEWKPDASLAAMNPAAAEYFLPPMSVEPESFGRSVALSDDFALVGMPGEASLATGINGDYHQGTYGSFGPGFGAAYSFELDATYGVFRYGVYNGANQFDLYSQEKPRAGTNFTMQVNLAEESITGPGFLMISMGTASTPLLGGDLLVDPVAAIGGPGRLFTVPIVYGANDPHSAEISFQLPAQVAGMTFFAQYAVPSPSAPLGIGLTNGLRVTIGPR